MKENIIIVDDERHILKACQRALRDTSFSCRVFSSPIDALEQAGGLNPAVVISDQRMPDMDGIRFLEAIRQRLPDATRVIMTGYADIEAAIQAINNGHVFRFIKKPWDDKTFKSEIVQAAEYYRMNQRLQQPTDDSSIKNNVEQERLAGVLEMAGAVCHEFAQPLQVIAGYCSLLTSLPRQELDADEVQGHLSCIADATEDLGTLLLKVMAIKRYKTKKYSEGSRIIDIDASSSKKDIVYRTLNRNG